MAYTKLYNTVLLPLTILTFFVLNMKVLISLNVTAFAVFGLLPILNAIPFFALISVFIVLSVCCFSFKKTLQDPRIQEVLNQINSSDPHALTELDLSFCLSNEDGKSYIDGETINTILEICPKLETLIVPNTKITDLSAIRTHTNLKSLNLPFSQDLDINTLLPQLKGFRNLEELDLSGSNKCSYVTDSLQETSIKRLHISDTQLQLTEENAHGLAKMPHLKAISIGQNSISEQSIDDGTLGILAAAVPFIDLHGSTIADDKLQSLFAGNTLSAIRTPGDTYLFSNKQEIDLTDTGIILKTKMGPALTGKAIKIGGCRVSDIHTIQELMKVVKSINRGPGIILEDFSDPQDQYTIQQLTNINTFNVGEKPEDFNDILLDNKRTLEVKGRELSFQPPTNT